MKTRHFSPPHPACSSTPGAGGKWRPGGESRASAGPGGRSPAGRGSRSRSQPVTCGGRSRPGRAEPRSPPLSPRPTPSQAGGAAAAARSVVPMEAGAEAEPLLPPRRWRAGRGLWRERGGARSAAEDGECPGRWSGRSSCLSRRAGALRGAAGSAGSLSGCCGARPPFPGCSRRGRL